MLWLCIFWNCLQYFLHSYFCSLLWKTFYIRRGRGAMVSLLVLQSWGRWFDPPLLLSFGRDFHPRSRLHDIVVSGLILFILVLLSIIIVSFILCRASHVRRANAEDLLGKLPDNPHAWCGFPWFQLKDPLFKNNFSEAVRVHNALTFVTKHSDGTAVMEAVVQSIQVSIGKAAAWRKVKNDNWKQLFQPARWP